MLSKIYSPTKQEQGFTLLELLVVIIVIGILAAIAIPLFLDQRKLAIDAAVKSDVRNTATQAQLWRLDNATAAAANASAYTAAGGKLVATKSNGYLGVVANADGSYSVCGYNHEGKVLTNSTSAFTFNSGTGQFTVGSGCDNAVDTNGQTDPNPTAGSGTATPAPSATPSASTPADPNPGSTPTPDPSTGTNPPGASTLGDALETNNNYQYNGGTIKFAVKTDYVQVREVGTTGQPLNVSKTPVLNGLTADNSVYTTASDIHVYNVSGNEKAQTLGNCSFTVNMFSPESPQNYYGFTDDFISGGLSCADVTADDSVFPADRYCQSDNTDPDACDRGAVPPGEFLTGGYLTFKDDQGRTNRLNLTDQFFYIYDN